ncbi:hypothetical protein, partial [Escherichia coli]|uniref:hypothetical protein n=1 Tax=Escherichia coli TaxID=562 RepID=UPI0028DF3E52
VGHRLSTTDMEGSDANHDSYAPGSLSARPLVYPGSHSHLRLSSPLIGGTRRLNLSAGRP